MLEVVASGVSVAFIALILYALGGAVGAWAFFGIPASIRP